MKLKRIVVRPYNPTWQYAFKLIRKRLQRVLHTSDELIHHIGSTAVKALPAKPIIDMDIEIKTIQSFEDTKQKLYRLGYHHVGDQGMYVCVSESSELKRHLAFRDYLIAHPKTKEAYGKLKLEAAKKHPYDMDAYLKMKGELINKVYRELGLD